MIKDLTPTKRVQSSFLSCEKDLGTILKKLFIESKPYSEELIRLLVINTKDCLDNRDNPVYNKKISEMGLKELIRDGYIRTAPRIPMHEHEEVKAYIIVTFDNFTETSNPEYRDCTISFDIICNTEYWDIGDYRLRPLKIAGYIDGILNNCRLSGIGELQFLGCNELVLDENLSGYTLSFIAVHGNDDKLEQEE